MVRAHVRPLWKLYQTAWRDLAGAARLEALLADYAHYQLFIKSRGGDEDAARRFQRYWARAIRKMARWGFTPDQLDEVTGIFFERVYARAARYTLESPFLAWLQTVLLNLCRDELRRLRRARARLTALEDPPDRLPRAREHRDPESALMRREDRAAIESALERLAPLDRHIVVRCLVGEESGQELARELGISRDALYQRLSRARRRLRRHLEEIRDAPVSDSPGLGRPP